MRLVTPGKPPVVFGVAAPPWGSVAAIIVPFGRSADRLPIGVQLVGRPFEDETVLAAGLALERAREDGPSGTDGRRRL